MNRTPWMFLALPLLGGCFGPSYVEGVWLVEVPPMEAEACEASITENFENADPYEEQDVPDSEWVYEDTTESSGSLFFVEVLEGKAGNAVLVMGDAAIPGTEEDGSFTFSWDDFSNGEESSTHESGYTYREQTDETSTTTLTFTKGKGGTATGKWSVQSSQNNTYAESDEWDYEATGVWSGEIQNVAFSYLDGDTANNPDSKECEDERCRLVLSQTCNGSVNVTMTWYASAKDDVYEGVSGAGQ